MKTKKKVLQVQVQRQKQVMTVLAKDLQRLHRLLAKHVERHPDLEEGTVKALEKGHAKVLSLLAEFEQDNEQRLH